MKKSVKKTKPKFSKTIQDRGANFRGDATGQLYLVRCYACDPDRGRENPGTMVASGQCAWCGWKEGGKSDVVH